VGRRRKVCDFLKVKKMKISLMPIQIIPHAIEIRHGTTFSYLRCQECAILLDAMGGMEPDDEE